MTEWDCFDQVEAEFKLFTEPRLLFDQAVEFCETEGSTLARISSAQEHAFVLSLVDAVDFDNFFIGTYT